MRTLELYNGNCLTELQKIADNTIDSVVTDPPYELGFMGKAWDASGIAFNVEVWRECLRVLKPGGHILAFGGTRTYHRMTVAIEDAGFEIRDCMAWMYGSGFPKSHNIGKAVDKLLGNDREVVGENPNVRKADSQKNTVFEGGFQEDNTITKGNSEWEGWGTALKPAFEPIVMGRKPFKGTVAENVLEWGVGGLNIDASRVGNESRTVPVHSDDKKEDETLFGLHPTIQHHREETTIGRWPANVMLDEEAGKILDEQSGTTYSGPTNQKVKYSGGVFGGGNGVKEYPANSGGASRFFYCPKASKKDRDEGMPQSVPQFTGRPRREDGSVIYKETHPEEWAEAMAKKKRKDKTALAGAEEKLQELNGPTQIKGRDAGQDSRSVAHKARPTARMNIHPTVKPTPLMEYLIKLVTPKGGKVLDPFMGSGSTGKGALLNDYSFVGIELSPEYFSIAESRIKSVENKTKFWC